MNATLQRYATPLITGLFLISLVSGIGLFVHVGTGAFRGMHEWLSMVLILPFVLHIWKNWRPMTIYFKKPAFLITMAVSLVAALAFAIPGTKGGSAGGPPQFAFAKLMIANTPAKVAPLLGYNADELVAKLKSAGFAMAAMDMPLSEIASKSGVDEFALYAALKAKAP